MRKNSTFLILHIAVGKSAIHCFDYLLPEDYQNQPLTPGVRVLIPFGKKEKIGVLLKADYETDVALEKLKPILAFLDQEPLFPPKLYALLEWASQYYQYPLGELLLAALPKKLRSQSKSDLKIPHYKNKDTTVSSSFHSLNAHQQQAIQHICQQQGFQVFLLEGVTGSGKTEVYLQAIESRLQQGYSALVLVPEIGLTPQTVARFTQRFKQPVAAWHSGLTETQRLAIWFATKNSEISIIIGTRSAIFLPFSNLGLIVLDEEHDQSFKQQSSFRYSARDLAIVRGRLEGIPVVLGSATPSLESYYNALQRRYQLLQLPTRAGNAIAPTFHIIDLRTQALDEGISKTLLAAISEHLVHNNQVLLFLNRRGYVPLLLCHNCGWSAHCLRCDAKLTLHLNPSRLICHHCTSQYRVPNQCGACKQTPLLQVGMGTERLEATLRKHFPDTSILRIDRDSVRKKGALEHVLEQINQGQAQILIGTQMLTKGHHFPNVTLVGIMDADSGLYSTDFRGVERMGQLIIQVAGRAGRAEKPGQVYLQTHYPNHPALQLLIQRNYGEFIQELLNERQQSYWPPFSFLALLRAEASKKQMPIDFLNEVKTLANTKNHGIELLGPIPALMEKKAGQFRGLLLFQAKNRTLLQKWLNEFIPQLENLQLGKKVRWSVDVDPQELV